MEECQAFLHHQDAQDYLDEHSVRLFTTYRRCASFHAKSIISIGAGSAFVEGALAQEGADVTVVDFPEMIANKHAFYSAMGFHELPADLEQIDDYSGLGQFDLVIASEIIEHLPSPPAREISRWTQAVAAGGRLVVTTPNLGSISHIFRLLWMKPLLPPAEQTFGPVGMENEGVHRREYMPREISDALEAAGLRSERIEFTTNRRPASAKDSVLRAFQIVPRFRPTAIFTGVRDRASS